MRKSRLCYFLFLWMVCSVLLNAQAQFVPLGGNSVLMKQKINVSQQRQTQAAPILLPFYDDFSYPGPYPNPNKWQNSQSVFVNHTYPYAPPTIGVATFDGLNRFGYPYNPAAQSGSVYSDSLISVPIRLDTLLMPGDSLYFSFYYQAKGRGDKPEQNDELRLYFFTDTVTFSAPFVWNHTGYNYSMNAGDTNFHLVMIRVDSIYRSKKFRFAFRNLSTQCGAIDHWHIDQVLLNKRTYSSTSPAMYDTIIPDVSMVYDEQTLLKNYMQMPYNQFTGPSDMKTRLNAFLRNNKSTLTTVQTFYSVQNNQGNIVNQSKSGGNGVNNVNNYWTSGYCNDDSLVKPFINNSFSYNGGPFPDSTSFLYKFYVNSGDTIRRNDTAYFRQVFNNYYAYDDGTAEGGLGIPSPSAQTAVRYKLNVADTLGALDIFFDPVFNVNLLLNDQIRIAVWSDAGGSPGNPIFIDSMATIYPMYSHSGYDIFQRYAFSKRVPLTAGQTFYVGVTQQLNIALAIGYDQNTDTHTNVFIKDPVNSSTWNQSNIKGSLMVRPVLGNSLQALGIRRIAAESEPLQIYPNPATNEVFVYHANGISSVMLCDMLGNTIREEKDHIGRIDVSSVPNGVYLLRAIDARGITYTKKLVIAR